MTAGAGTLEAHLRARRDAGRKLLVPYVTGGIDAGWVDVRARRSPRPGPTPSRSASRSRDPVMDGPTIQEASRQALERGTTPASILTELRPGRRRSTCRWW